MMDFTWTRTERVKIEVHSLNASGHALPMLRMIEILQKMNSNFDLTFITSKWWVEKKQAQFP